MIIKKRKHKDSVVCHQILEIGKRFAEYYFNSKKDKEITIFLCGAASSSKENLRFKLGNVIREVKSKYKYTVFYPENMFIDLTLGHPNEDLLTLENFLAENVDIVVILLNGPGPFVELGAFSNDKRLRNKIIVLIDHKYKKERSFINLGPVKLLKKQSCSEVLYQKITEKNLKDVAGLIREKARVIAKNNWKVNMGNSPNPIEFYYLILSLTYIYSPIPEEAFRKIFVSIRGAKIDIYDRVFTSLSSSLIKNNLINRTSKGFSVTNKGINNLHSLYGSKSANDAFNSSLNLCRFDYLDLYLRKLNNKTWW